MTACYIDHLVITAPTLESGAVFIKEALGVEMLPGGKHPRMGTHNSLLRLGDSTYLEVLAIDPEAPTPNRPRWFELDSLSPASPPRLTTWIARTTDIKAATEASTEALGTVEAMGRGALNWLITIPKNGDLNLDGLAPMLIEWHTNSHPAASMPDSGCSLVKLEVFHPQPERIKALLDSIHLEGPISVSPSPAGESSYLVAHIQTPAGLRQTGIAN